MLTLQIYPPKILLSLLVFVHLPLTKHTFLIKYLASMNIVPLLQMLYYYTNTSRYKPYFFQIIHYEKQNSYPSKYPSLCSSINKPTIVI